ncbi:MAG TPA: hypothetical protein PLD91_12815 [Spirochaetota bacterium]|nr:hypothetical protein [Spirochaetota bacterium]
MKKAKLEVKEELLLLNPDCILDKKGVEVHTFKAFFPFDKLSDSNGYKLQNGLWDKINILRKDKYLSVAIRVDLTNPREHPGGFDKFAALMYGISFNQILLNNCCGEMPSIVHFNDNATKFPDKTTMAMFYRKEDDVVIIYLEALVPPDPTTNSQTSFLHCEYNKSTRNFSHIDGSIKTYSQKLYEKRYNETPTKATHSDINYNKIFRIDGNISFSEWLNLIPAFFNSNPLIEEMLKNAHEYYSK